MADWGLVKKLRNLEKAREFDKIHTISDKIHKTSDVILLLLYYSSVQDWGVR